ncbi:MAG: CDP-diacylglycerol--glycerol-3-phosphate 3-phosphatidyltransferase [Gammaproteobacteria bacterium]|nr:CDP-diacylglycerol--glycerol-3-phosphate 3-phosphatidyltransferase [Gammaproteobacteria bacterium]
MVLNLPNALTWFRIVAIPLVVVVFYLPVTWARPAAGLLFALAGITDYFDGYLARRLNQTSSFGAFLDPVADKLIVSTALVLLVQADPQIQLAVVAGIIIGREITVSALREWMSEIGARAHVAVTFFGKWKTTLQIIGISLMLYEQPIFGIELYPAGTALLFIAAALTIWSMLDYLRAAWPLMLRQG